MRVALGRGAASWAHALLLSTTILIAAPAAAQPAFSGGDWGTRDGGAVVIKANGVYELAITDASNGNSIFSSGKVVKRESTADGQLSLTLKPAVVSGSRDDGFVVVVAADGSAVLFVVDGGARHEAAKLQK